METQPVSKLKKQENNLNFNELVKMDNQQNAGQETMEKKGFKILTMTTIFSQDFEN